MIRIERQHYAERAFRKPLVVKRAGGALCVRMTFERATPVGHQYELEAFSPKASRAERVHAFYEVIEDRRGKWVLGGLRRIERSGMPLRGREASVAVPAAVQRELLRLMAELDEAVANETPGPPPKPPAC